nr:reverse transcriptase domain-containing protein [Tanacetum cinerariifolium]
MSESNRGIRSHGKANGVLLLVQGNRSRHMKRIRDNESPLSSMSKSDSSDGRKIRSHLESIIFESSRRTQMPNNVKTYDGTRDLEDYVKIFHAAAHVERWAMITWCHMFNTTLIGAVMVWFVELLPESIDSYKYLKAAFLAYFMQQKKYVKDMMKIHNIKQKDGETIEDFMERFKVKTGRMKGAPEYKRSDFWGYSREEKGSNRFTPVTRTPKEILAAEAGKFQPPPPMVTPVEKRSSNKFCDFHNDKGHSTNESSNNEAEYEALIAGLRIVAQMGVQNVHVSVDSKLVANQVLGTYVSNEENMVKSESSGDNHWQSVKHPQSNGLVERANQSLEEGIMARLGERNKNWVEELPHVFRAHRIMIKSSHVDTPLSLTYGTEAVIHVEIGMPTYRTAIVDVVRSDEELWINLNLLEEPGDFVYRNNDASHAVAGGKLGPKWERPYEVTKAPGDGAYKLRSMDGTILPRTWNIANLKRCYL